MTKQTCKGMFTHKMINVHDTFPATKYFTAHKTASNYQKYNYKSGKAGSSKNSNASKMCMLSYMCERYKTLSVGCQLLFDFLY